MGFTVIKTDSGKLAIPSYIEFIYIKKCYPEMQVLSTNTPINEVKKQNIKIVKTLG